MNILGIETSCDETAAAVVKNGHTILSNIVASSLKDHAKYGGVIPEIASRKQLEFIHSVIDEAIMCSGQTLKNIDGIAVTTAPGLLGSLLVGISYAKAISFALDKPLIEVDHIKAHLYANFIRPKNDTAKLPLLPAIGLVVSGGHSSLYHIKDFTRFKLLGQTRDDAAGEAFDKVARILDLGYPGGPAIDRLAKERSNHRLTFPPSRLTGSFDFSFSGTKTAVLYHHRQHQHDPDYNQANIADAFQQSVISILAEKSIDACMQNRCSTLVVGGGVAANSALRQKLKELAARQHINVYYPPIKLCMDNAAMIAGYGYHCYNDKEGINGI